MSRVGNRTIIIPTGVTASVDGNTVTVTPVGISNFLFPTRLIKFLPFYQI